MGAPRIAPAEPTAAEAAETDWWTSYVRQLPPWIRFFLPFVFMSFPLFLTQLFAPLAAPKLASVLAVVVFAVDAAVVTGLARGLVWWIVGGTVIWVEFWIIVWLLSNLEALRRWRPAGKFFARKERRAERMYHQKAWLRRFHFWGVVAITFLPLGSGVILGTLLAKLTGMKDRRAIGAVFLGTVLWVSFLTFVFALSIDEIKDWIERIPGGRAPA